MNKGNLLTYLLKSGGGGCEDLSLSLLMKIISFVLARFNFRLLVNAHCSTFCSSAAHEWLLLAGMMRYVSSAYLTMKLEEETVRRSAAVTTYEAGPIAEP